MGCLSCAWYHCPKQVFTFFLTVNLDYNCTAHFSLEGKMGLREVKQLTHSHTAIRRQWQCAGGLVTKPCLTLCDPVDCSPPGSSVHGISQARVLEWAAISFSRGSSQPRNQTRIRVAGRFFTAEPPGAPIR